MLNSTPHLAYYSVDNANIVNYLKYFLKIFFITFWGHFLTLFTTGSFFSPLKKKNTLAKLSMLCPTSMPLHCQNLLLRWKWKSHLWNWKILFLKMKIFFPKFFWQRKNFVGHSKHRFCHVIQLHNLFLPKFTAWHMLFGAESCLKRSPKPS